MMGGASCYATAPPVKTFARMFYGVALNRACSGDRVYRPRAAVEGAPRMQRNLLQYHPRGVNLRRVGVTSAFRLS